MSENNPARHSNTKNPNAHQERDEEHRRDEEPRGDERRKPGGPIFPLQDKPEDPPDEPDAEPDAAPAPNK